MFITKVPISLLEAVLGLVLPLHTVLVLQIYLRLMKMVPIDYPYPKTLGLTPKIKSTKVTISLLEVVLGLLQRLHPVLDLQINLRLW